MGNEQWLESGDCNRCRRQKYCTKDCKRHTTRKQNDLKSAVISSMLKFLNKK